MLPLQCVLLSFQTLINDGMNLSQVLMGGLSHWTVGLVATLTAVLCIVAADTGAYFVGKNLGKTQLIRISPKKTVEGAIGGLCSSGLTALACFKVFRWPGSPIAAIGFAVRLLHYCENMLAHLAIDCCTFQGYTHPQACCSG